MSFSDGLGNIMFQYAGLKGIALRHNATLLIMEGLTWNCAFQHFLSLVIIKSSIILGSAIHRAFKLCESTIVVSKFAAKRLMQTYNQTTFKHCCKYYDEVFWKNRALQHIKHLEYFLFLKNLYKLVETSNLKFLLSNG